MLATSLLIKSSQQTDVIPLCELPLLSWCCRCSGFFHSSFHDIERERPCKWLEGFGGSLFSLLFSINNNAFYTGIFFEWLEFGKPFGFDYLFRITWILLVPCMYSVRVCIIFTTVFWSKSQEFLPQYRAHSKFGLSFSLHRHLLLYYRCIKPPQSPIKQRIGFTSTNLLSSSSFLRNINSIHIIIYILCVYMQSLVSDSKTTDSLLESEST